MQQTKGGSKITQQPHNKNYDQVWLQDYEETVNKYKWNETLQQKPIETTEILHGFHHIEQSIKS
jgi:hypothetical protein